MSVKKNKKKKPIVIKTSACRKIKRSDGLKMKWVQEYTFRGFLEAITSRFGNLKAYSIFGDEEDKFISYNRLKWGAENISTYLLEKGFNKGDRVAIVGESCPFWMMMYLGITYVGCVAVPILPDFSQREMEGILKESGAKAVCVNVKHFKKVEKYAYSNNLMVVRMEDLTQIPSIPEGFTFENAPGISLKEHSHNYTLINTSVPSEDDMASLIFTSGTTGSSKGVILTHKNLLVCADESSDTYVKVKKGVRVLSILPMSHCYEFTITHLLCLLQGAEIVFLGKPPATTILMRAFKEVRPHVILTVPLLIEKIYKAAVLPTLRDNPKIAKLYKNPLTKWIVLKTVKTKLISTMGGCIRFFGIGGAPLDETVWDFLYSCHFPYALGYGLTETSPLIAGCGPKHKMHKKGYIGKPVKHDHVILLNKNEDGVGEIAVKGPNVMTGYYNNEALNKEVFTEDGYFKTGDLGYLDKHGYLSIRGRVKTMILGPAGENIYPESIESLINNMEFVQESLVVPGDGGLVALIKIDLEAMQEKLKISATDVKDEAEKYLVKLKKSVNEQLSSFSKIADTELQEKDFERTPTQKIKRFLYSRKKKEEK